MDTYAMNLPPHWLVAANDTGTTDAEISPEALAPSQKFARQKVSIICVTSLAKHLLQAEAARVQRGEICLGSWQVMSNRLDAHILPLLGPLPAAELRTVHAQDLIDHLGAKGLSTTTIAQYLVLLRKVAMQGVLRGVLQEMPQFPKVKIRSQPRGSFSVREYRALVAAARSLREQPHPQLETLAPGNRFWIARELLYMPAELPWLIRWMVNTFVRPSDIKFVQHKHVEVVRGRSLYLRLRLPETKRHSQPMVSLRPAVHVYEQLLAHRREQGMAGPDDYLFMPQIANRDHALALLGFFFQWALRQTHLEKGPQGQTRTLYCLRHTAITLRLLYGQGIDMLTLARNARTSVNMIERFYASTLSGEMNVEMLQSRRGKRT
ncbi:MAG: hypothetical protein EOO27_19455 [Comamonadaceae bacterium]|nr:MAG: hypothetical protein EOO27_19455 [Comamonadaceae bacterium]